LAISVQLFTVNECHIADAGIPHLVELIV